MLPKKDLRGFTLLEIVVSILVFLAMFGGAMKFYSEAGLPQQGMIRDYAIALNISEKFINSIQNDFMSGNPPPSSPDEQDVTEAVLDNPLIQDYLKVFSGGVGKDSTELTTNFKAFLHIQEESDELKRIKVRFEWGQRQLHSFTLQTLIFVR